MVTFFLADHSKASARATNLDRELALNYREGARTARAPAFRAPSARAEEDDESDRPQPSATSRAREIERGMRSYQVRRRLGRPQRETRSGDRVRWTYPDCTVLFEGGRVVEVRF